MVEALGKLVEHLEKQEENLFPDLGSFADEAKVIPASVCKPLEYTGEDLRRELNRLMVTDLASMAGSNGGDVNTGTQTLFINMKGKVLTVDELLDQKNEEIAAGQIETDGDLWILPESDKSSQNNDAVLGQIFEVQPRKIVLNVELEGRETNNKAEEFDVPVTVLIPQSSESDESSSTVIPADTGFAGDDETETRESEVVVESPEDRLEKLNKKLVYLKEEKDSNPCNHKATSEYYAVAVEFFDLTQEMRAVVETAEEDQTNL